MIPQDKIYGLHLPLSLAILQSSVCSLMEVKLTGKQELKLADFEKNTSPSQCIKQKSCFDLIQQ